MARFQAARPGNTRAPRLTRILAATAIGLTLGATGCRPAASDVSSTSAITNRPQSYDRFIAILKLKTPALLSTARKENGKVLIDTSLRQAILDEQAQTEKDLLKLSPDIQILYHYRMVLNGLAVIAPRSLEDKFAQLTSVSYMEHDNGFSRLKPLAATSAESTGEDIVKNNSVSFIEADKVHEELTVPGPDGRPVPVDGRGVKVGVIDTGIDYTHAMFGGAGTEQAYKSDDPTKVVNGDFPTAKVVGGIDFVGTDYDSGSPRFDQHIPKPDANPLDEAGHGSHVAGTIAGLGDGTNTYSGVAPGAELYGLKVFGKEGSTGDAVIIAALEWAADPNGDLDGADRLDVVNLSLGSDFGTPHILYSEAVTNLVKGDTVMVAAAGNAGASPYIVGAPGTSTDAISVAAVIGGMEHNWKFSAIGFKTAQHPDLYTEAPEASVTKPIAEAGNVSGKLVFVGLAAADFPADVQAKLKGNVAFIDRGQVNFSDKIRRAQDSGAIGVVVANNVAGDPFVMGGDGQYNIPAVMVSQAIGDTLKADMQTGDATVNFSTDHKIAKPELIDTLADFSSRGPRSIDGAIKPEIAAPGFNVISAKMGSGDKGVQFSGTSMATPHMTGVIALLRQAHPELSALELKSLVMETATPIHDRTGKAYSVADTGAGRVRAYEAATAKLAILPAALSLGEVPLETAKVVRESLKLENLSDKAATYTLTAKLSTGLSLRDAPGSITLAAHEAKTIDLLVRIDAPKTDDVSKQLDGSLVFDGGDAGSYHVPVLAVVNRTSQVAAKALKIYASSPADDSEAEAELTLANTGSNPGQALIFNLLGNDKRKELARENSGRNNICDLQSAGWRVVKETVDGSEKSLLQVAVKIYSPVTSWQLCDVSVLVDADGDGVADQELVGTALNTLTGNDKDVDTFVSALTDATQMRKIRRDYEAAFPNAPALDYSPAVIDAQDDLATAHSTVAVLEADLSKLAKTSAGDLKIQLVVQSDGPDGDDYLGSAGKWLTLTPTEAGQAYVGLPNTVDLAPGATKTVSLRRGQTPGKLVVYMPYNRTTPLTTVKDAQMQTPKVTYAF